VRAVINRIIVLEIDKGQLTEAESVPSFQDALSDILRKVRLRGVALPFSLPVDRAKVVSVTSENHGQSLLEFRKFGYTLLIKSGIVSQIKEMLGKASAPSTLAKLDGRKLDFLRTLELDVPSNMPRGFARHLLVATLNDEVVSNSQELFLVIALEERVLVVVNRKWFSRSATSALTNLGTYNISKLASLVGVPIAFDVLKEAVVEANRLDGMIIDHGWFETE
jgi:hypothetical protein